MSSPLKAPANTSSMRIIWTAFCTDSWDEDYIVRVMDQAVREKVTGIELCYRGVDRLISYRSFPPLHPTVNKEALEKDQGLMRQICVAAQERKLRLGLWHHELLGPRDWLERMPELRAKDGLIDLENPLLYHYIREKCVEFFGLFPTVDELVITLTETQYVATHRPFSTTPPAERIRRILQALADITDPLGKQLVIRPFSAVRKDELYVREAVEQLQAKHVSVMYKTEPFDWNPFLPDEPLIGSIPKYEVRAETDAGAEYYGQENFPVCNARYIRDRLESARQKGATVAAIRIDRGVKHCALGHPLCEVNAIAPTRWSLNPSRPLDEYWTQWLQERHGFHSTGMIDLLEKTFDVIKKTFYIDHQSITHHGFPSFDRTRHLMVFSLFEEKQPLSHITEHWSMLPDRTTLTHKEILLEKEEALALSREILRQFDMLSKGMKEDSRREIRDSLERLEILSESFLALSRTIIAHVEEITEGSPRTVSSFEMESAPLLQLAAKVEKLFGKDFFRGMPERMSSFVKELDAERKLEFPLHKQMRGTPGLVDYVLCGFPTEGHRFTKRVHTGKVFPFQDRVVRSTGLGPDQGVTYHLKIRAGQPHELVLLLAGNGPEAPLVIRVDTTEFPLQPGPFQGLREFRFPLKPSNAGEIAVSIWSTTIQPACVSVLQTLAK